MRPSPARFVSAVLNEKQFSLLWSFDGQSRSNKLSVSKISRLSGILPAVHEVFFAKPEGRKIRRGFWTSDCGLSVGMN